MPAKEKMSEPEFRRIINALCERWHIPEYADNLSQSYWPAFSQLDEAGQRAFWDVLGVQEEYGKEAVDALCNDQSDPERH